MLHSFVCSKVVIEKFYVKILQALNLNELLFIYCLLNTLKNSPTILIFRATESNTCLKETAHLKVFKDGTKSKYKNQFHFYILALNNLKMKLGRYFHFKSIKNKIIGSKFNKRSAREVH